MSEQIYVSDEDYLARLRSSKSKASVQLLEFISLRSKIGRTRIYVFEGGDDKIVYSQWIRRCGNSVAYEPFVCNNKEQVLKLHRSIMSNLNNMNRNVLFFIDRDFDDYKGYSSSDRLFMTDRYAVENYIVCTEVIDDLLKNEFPCHGNPEIRENIIRIFDEIYKQFLIHLRDLNFHIYSARKRKIELNNYIPDSLRAFVVINCDSIELIDYDPKEIIPHADEDESVNSDDLKDEFNTLEPASRYRGKFAYKFFHKWLLSLAEEFKNSDSTIFTGVDRTKNVRVSEIVLSNLASKSPLPKGLCEFVSRSL